MFSHSLAQDIKHEVLAELRRRKNPTGSGRGGNPIPPAFGIPGQGSRTNPYTGETGQTIKESVKNEIMAEIQMQEADQLARLYGVDRSLSDRRIQQMIDARYRTIDNMKTDIKRELLALQKIEEQRGKDPYINQIAGVLAEEARRQGIPLEQVARSLEQKTANGNGMMGRLAELLNAGQRRGFLCGLGMAILISLIWPFARSNVRPVAVRSLEEGLSMVDRAKNFIRGNPQQKPPADLTNFEAEPPPPESQPPGGDNYQQ